MKEKYIYHVTINTGDIRKSPRSEVDQDIIDLMKKWIKNLEKGELQAVYEDKYAVRINQSSGKMIEFYIFRIDDNFEQTDLIQMVVCKHSSKKEIAWSLFGENNSIPVPKVPFCGVKLIQENIKINDFPHLSLLADFERCLAWGWLES